MNLLLDTNVVVAIVRGKPRDTGVAVAAALAASESALFVSAASIWEIAIKTRLGKLDVGVPLDRVAVYCVAAAMTLLVVDHRHAVAMADPEPATRDPFDRLLLAQCAVENMKLLTTDRALRAHPLSWRPA